MAVVFPRDLVPPGSQSFFLFGPRGTGKSTWLRQVFPDAVHLDLLDLRLYTELLAHPERLEAMVRPTGRPVVVLDEVQRLPALLDEVHRLIEARRWRFIMTGSSARKLRRGGANLLAGRARTLTMHPLTAHELGKRFVLEGSLRHGHLPMACTEPDPAGYLASYAGTYLREEVQAEALTRNLDAFARFLVTASFSQASVLSVAPIARELGVARKSVEAWFDLLDDLLLGVRLPVFTRRARRALVAHPKFYLFDAGVFRALRPRGPLDSVEETDGAALETLVMQELRATNDNHGLGYQLSYWRTRDGKEVDFVLYGERGLHAVEVKRSGRFRDEDLDGLRLFRADYPAARCALLYGGEREYDFEGIRVLPLSRALPRLPTLLGGAGSKAGARR
ncbi:MAG: ATP-binding protein [Deltaproteobacteria bacterium]|nr:ATP-binding protein [Deltaproteobacteria bacterium]